MRSRTVWLVASVLLVGSGAVAQWQRTTRRRRLGEATTASAPGSGATPLVPPGRFEDDQSH